MTIAAILTLLLLAAHLASASDPKYAEKIDAIFAGAGVKARKCSGSGGARG